MLEPDQNARGDRGTKASGGKGRSELQREKWPYSWTMLPRLSRLLAELSGITRSDCEKASANASVIGGTGAVNAITMPAAIDDGKVFTGRGDARLRAQVTLWPRVLVARARADLDYFQRSATTFTQDAITGESTVTTSALSELALETRAYLDLELARFVGFVPSLNGGVNVFAATMNGVKETAVLPVIALGFRRDVF